MSEPQQYTATPRKPRWQDLSDKHQNVRQRLESALTDFGQGKGALVKSIVGAYGSGKSELMAWGFRYAWVELDTPAIYVNLETLLKHLPQHLGPTELADEIERFLQDQLVQIDQSLDCVPRTDDICLAIDVRPEESLADYFRALYDDPQLDLDRIRRALAKERAVFFLDEIEQKYSELMERVETSDQAPLREVLQRVEQGQVPFYLVMSFGLTSAYESMSGADARRVDTLVLPIPDAKELGKLSQAAAYRNLIWWASRGRPGWAVNLAQNWGKDLPGISSLEQFANDLAPTNIESIPLVDVNAVGGGVLASSPANRAMAVLTKTIAPIPIRQIVPGDADSLVIQTVLESMPQCQFLIASKEEHLVPVETFVDEFLRDLMKLAETIGTPDYN